MSNRFRIKLADMAGNEIKGFSISVLSASVQDEVILVDTMLSKDYIDMPERMKECGIFNITIDLMSGGAIDGEPASLKTITEKVKLTSTSMDLDYELDEPLPVLYTLQKINTRTEESN